MDFFVDLFGVWKFHAGVSETSLGRVRKKLEEADLLDLI